jgi:hypothetical protein
MTVQPCAHCGRICGDSAGGYGSILGEQVCHPNKSDRPDCNRLVTVYGETLGSRLGEAGYAIAAISARPNHKPVVLVAADWPDMEALKAHAASLGADVEVSELPASKSCRIVWVPKGLEGNATDAVYRQYLGQVKEGVVAAAAGLSALEAAFDVLGEAFAALKPPTEEQSL